MALTTINRSREPFTSVVAIGIVPQILSQTHVVKKLRNLIVSYNYKETPEMAAAEDFHRMKNSTL